MPWLLLLLPLKTDEIVKLHTYKRTSPNIDEMFFMNSAVSLMFLLTGCWPDVQLVI